MAQRQTERKPRRGRPRKDGSTSVDQRAEILQTAVGLFTEKGFQRTSMTEIAHTSGLSQSSLYYWYANKAAIVQDLLVKNHLSNSFVESLRASGAPCTAQLYAVLVTDLKMLCTLPFDYYDLEHLAQTHRAEFQDFYDTYNQLCAGVKRIIEQGMEEGAFHASDPSAAAMAALTLNEGLQHRYRASRLDAEGASSTHTDPAIAHFNLDRFVHIGAEGSLRMLMHDQDFVDIKSTAERLIESSEAAD